MGDSKERLPVHECFYSWQGEGEHLGRAAYFVRLFGCPVHCPWCDSAGTWHPDFVPKDVERLMPVEIAERAAASGAEFVVVTGGEPAIHDLRALTREIANRGIARHLETSGGFEIRGDFDWITLSPKWQKMPLESCLAAASEFKLIVEDAESITRWMTVVGEHFSKVKSVWLHPEWSQRTDAAVLRSITNWVKEHGDPFRAGYQMHKLFDADLLDPNSRESAPLGGDQSKGY